MADEKKLNVKTMSDDEVAELHRSASEELERRRPKVDLKEFVPGQMTPEQEKDLLAEVVRVVGRL